MIIRAVRGGGATHSLWVNSAYYSGAVTTHTLVKSLLDGSHVNAVQL